MDSCIQVFSVIANFDTDYNLSISFNTDFLEANVINILLLLLGLMYVLKEFLGSILVDRQEKVLLAIQESEERLKQANSRLSESEKQLAQTQMVIAQIIKEAETTAQKVRQSILDQGKADVDKLISASKASIATAEVQIKQQIQLQVTSLAIKRVTMQLQDQITPNIQTRIIDNNIAQLGGYL
uniref:ATP synthase subunit b, chloroplastic n=1 Tax=Gracilaria tenuistipitata var. liui TaxID=285951 RepID=ATPF_GRATL|nr:ATP synthase CF0 B subunit [Gracilaria tenuistipitata var. liui]Q6B8R0.1 RecName: Full=ATP synthase subunit b, chloroplastic; AltName: Full=ATP synthase F(0) sector subunit b; AltName: Full=ATPase subunit I [Gracilaria tenuistipitata var. liui]AAT79725.1 ATP synthase CF0 B chain subunit I [Gracilaria tenuistipitata var. liui]